MAKDLQTFVSEDQEINEVQANTEEVLREVNLELEEIDPDELERVKEEAEAAAAAATAAAVNANAAAAKADEALEKVEVIEAEYVKDVSASGNNIIVKHEDDSTTSIPIVTSETQSDWNETDTGDVAYIKNRPVVQINSNTTGVAARKVLDATKSGSITTITKSDNSTFTISDGEANVIETVSASAPLVANTTNKNTNIAIPAATDSINGYMPHTSFADLETIKGEYTKDVAFNNSTYEVTVKDQGDAELSFVALPEPLLADAGKVLQINAAGDQWILVSAAAAAGTADELASFVYAGAINLNIPATIYAVNNVINARRWDPTTKAHVSFTITATDAIFPAKRLDVSTGNQVDFNIPLR